jgi:phosphopantetheinyl transferase/malonyl CoA-acyl carrier protein transacylase
MESELVMLGGSDRTHLLEVIQQLVDYMKRAPFPVLRDIALTTGTAAHDALGRAVVVATSCDDLMTKLLLLCRRLSEGKERALPGKGVFLSTDLCPAPGRTVFVFPGEGSQYPDMLRDLCLHFPACRSAFDDADTASALAKSPMLPSQWIFPTGAQAESGVNEAFGMAGAIQAVLAADTAFLRLFTQLGITPDAVVGVGVGEITALECAGVLNFASRTDRLNALRDGYTLLKNMANSSRTPRCVCLSAEGLHRDALSQCLGSFANEVVIARDHSTNLFGLCVRQPAAEPVMQALKEAGATVRILPVYQPYHTPWMDHVKPDLAAFFGRLVNQSPSVPVYSCMTAAPHEGPLAAWVENAASQWTRPLRFADTIQRLYDDGFRVFVELGARGSLTASIDTILNRRPHLALAVNRGHRSDIQQLHHTLAELAAHGQKIDIAQLHINRGSRLLDLSRPRPSHAQRVERTIPLGTTLPSLRAAEIPRGLVAPQAPAPVGLRPIPQADRNTAPADDGRTDFPLLLDAEILSFVPDESIELVTSLSIFDQPFLADSAFGSTQVSLTESTLRGLPLMPLGMLAEALAEAARKLAPAQVVVGIEKFATPRWLTVEGSTRSVRIAAKRLPQTEGGVHRFQATVYDRDLALEHHTPALIAQAIVCLADAYAPPAHPPRTLALRGPVKLDWHGIDLYPMRLHHGPAFQNIHAIPQWGENGLVASWVALPRSNLLRRTTAPRFSIDPVLLGAIGASLAAWDAREACHGQIQLPVSFERATFCASPPAEWSRGQLKLFLKTSERREANADAEIIDADGRILFTATNWRNRVFPIGPALHNLLLHPTEAFLTREVPQKLLPSLPQEVVCCIADTFSSSLLTDDDDLWLRATAYLTLSLTERLKWREMGGTTHRRAEWLLGRIAAKDSVRHCLQTRYGRKWAAADIRIETDEAGKPCPQGEWRRHCGARMDISITHTTDHIVAAVAPNACLGIDIEKRDRAISDDFAAAAFGVTEQEIAAESGEGATALFRFWCAKEALVKALGTGLRYGASDLLVRHYDRPSGRLAVEATRLWAQAFPALRNTPIYVHSCLLDNLVLAVCVLDSSMLKELNSLNPSF